MGKMVAQAGPVVDEEFLAGFTHAGWMVKHRAALHCAWAVSLRELGRTSYGRGLASGILAAYGLV